MSVGFHYPRNRMIYFHQRTRRSDIWMLTLNAEREQPYKEASR